MSCISVCVLSIEHYSHRLSIAQSVWWVVSQLVPHVFGRVVGLLVLRWRVVVAAHLAEWGVWGQFPVMVVGLLAGVLVQLLGMGEDALGFFSVIGHMVLPRCMILAHCTCPLLLPLATCQMSLERGPAGQAAEVVDLWHVGHGMPSGLPGGAAALL